LHLVVDLAEVVVAVGTADGGKRRPPVVESS